MKLSRESLDDKIKKRAEERVQQRIKTFKDAVVRAANELLRSSHQLSNFSHKLPDDMRAVFAVLASDNHRKGWPSSLWSDESARVEDEVLGTMNELQKVLLARGIASENEPEHVAPPQPETISA